MSHTEYTGMEIAIIGMDGRFPGARNVKEFWENLKQAKETISHFTKDELLQSGIPEAEVGDPQYIRSKGMLEAIDRFDADFFGMLPKEAELLDPQVRIFMETAWRSLEDAGYIGERFSGAIGVYAGAALNTYMFQIVSNPDALKTVDDFQLMLGNDKDLLSLRTAYKLDLRGPAVTVQSTCSTSLVAVHLACQGLLSGECDMALAGGVSLLLPQKKGYRYQDGMIYSPDGHCRPFDAKAGGTVFGDGVGVVVLKRLEDALEDGDHIYAIIKGTAVNNDGTDKVGFTAPSVEGQARVIKAAMAMAEVEPDTISYIEAHGTGTQLGDPIEVTALTQVFREQTDEKGFCAIGSVKSNVGHLNTAAGVTGLIKTALALKHKQIPPSIQFETPNPKIDFANSPFYVQTELADWECKNGPRRAGVSSFGIGGTNVHIILEEAPEMKSGASKRNAHLITLSARTEKALEKATDQLVQQLEENPHLDLADVAYTLRVGRKDFAHRRYVVASDSREAAQRLKERHPKHVFYSRAKEGRPVVFLFPGQGSQYVNMGKELYEKETVFRQEVDRCAEFLKRHLGLDIRQLIYPIAGEEKEAERRLTETRFTQPALFTIEYALAKQWMAWGIKPEAMMGHSVGEYVAATLSGVMRLEDGLKLIAERGRMIQELPSGEMMAVRMTEEQVKPYLVDGVSLAAINSPMLCVLSGSKEAIDALAQKLEEEGKMTRRLHTSHAFHSHMMEPVVEPFTELVGDMELSVPSIPFVSNVTGTWITDEQATDPAYWARHLREAVRYADGVKFLWQKPERVLLEVGPGRTLTMLAKQQAEKGADQVAVSSIRHPQDAVSDEAALAEARGRLWLAGVTWDDEAFYAEEKRLRVSLPAYPFEGKRYWIEGHMHSVHSLRANVENPSAAKVSQTVPDPALEEEAGVVEQEIAAASEYVGPRNELEELLADVLKEIMGIEQVSVYDDFFEIGGNSLVASQAVARMRDVLDMELPVQLLFEKRTIADLAEEVERRLLEEIEDLSDEEAQKLVERS